MILPISLCTAFATLMDDGVLVLPLDMLQYDRHKPSVDEVLSRFKHVCLSVCLSVSYMILPISLCTAFATLMDDGVLVLPLDMLQYDRHKPSVDEVPSRFKQV